MKNSTVSATDVVKEKPELLPFPTLFCNETAFTGLGNPKPCATRRGEKKRGGSRIRTGER